MTEFQTRWTAEHQLLVGRSRGVAIKKSGARHCRREPALIPAKMCDECRRRYEWAVARRETLGGCGGDLPAMSSHISSSWQQLVPPHKLALGLQFQYRWHVRVDV